MHGNEWHGYYEPLHAGSLRVPETPPGAIGHTLGFQAQEPWLKVDSLGNVTTVQADRQRLVKELNIPFRDLRMLDPSLRIPYPLALFVRAKAIIMNFESIRMIVTHNEAFVLSTPVPGQSLLVGSPAKLQAPFVKHLVRRVRPHGSNDSPEHDSMMRQPHFDTDLPYELRCLEAALDGALSVMDMETSKLESDAGPLIRSASQKVTRPELELLRDLRSTLSKLTTRVSRLKAELETVLGSEEEMEMMFLARRAEAAASQPQDPFQQQQPPANPRHDQQQGQQQQQQGQQQQQQQQQQQEQAPRCETRASLDVPRRTSLDIFRGAAAAEEASDREHNAADELRDEAAEGGDEGDAGPPRRRTSPKDSWRHSVRQVTQILHTMKSLKTVTLQSDKSTWSCANLLDSNLMHCDHMVQRLEMLRERLTSTEKFIDAELDHRRNELVGLDIWITALMAMFGFVAMVAGLLGMNLTNGYESSHAMFLIITYGSLAAAAALFAGIIYFASSRNLLLIPDKSKDE